VSVINSAKPPRIALVDNTLQVDRKKGKEREQHIERLLDEFDWTVTTSICLLEFKATLLQEFITIHNKLRSDGRYTVVRDRLTESPHRQAKLRSHIFQNLISVYAPSSFEVTDQQDRELAEKARLLLELHIPQLYKWFSKSVDTVFRDGTKCTRAEEPPTKGPQRVSFDANLPHCKRGRNKFCRVEAFILEKGPEFVEKLHVAISAMGDEDAAQLKGACDVLDSVVRDPNIQLSRGECRRAGDCLIALEGSGLATHALSTNARDWSVVSGLLGLEFVKPEYPKG